MWWRLGLAKRVRESTHLRHATRLGQTQTRPVYINGSGPQTQHDLWKFTGHPTRPANPFNLTHPTRPINPFDLNGSGGSCLNRSNGSTRPVWPIGKYLEYKEWRVGEKVRLTQWVALTSGRERVMTDEGWPVGEGELKKAESSVTGEAWRTGRASWSVDWTVCVVRDSVVMRRGPWRRALVDRGCGCVRFARDRRSGPSGTLVTRWVAECDSDLVRRSARVLVGSGVSGLDVWWMVLVSVRLCVWLAVCKLLY